MLGLRRINMFAIASFVIFSVFVVAFYRFFEKSKTKWPPGPYNLPIVGSVISVARADAHNPAKAFTILSKKYGEIFTVKLGSVNTVVISGHAALSKLEFADDLMSRVDGTETWILEKSNQLPLGLLLSLPSFWADTWTFTQKSFRKHGFHTKHKTEPIIVKELVEFCDHLRQSMTDGEVTIQITTLFKNIFFNIVWTLLTGKKCTTDDDLMRRRFVKAMQEYMYSGNFGGSLSALFPELIKQIPALVGFPKLQKTCREWREVTKEAIDQLRQNRKVEFQSDDNFIDAFLTKLDSTPKPENIMETIFTDENLTITLQDLMLGGTDTQSYLLKFFVRYLLQYPQVQRKLHAEVDQVIGKHRNVSTEDIPSLTYTQAVLHEVFRHACVVTLTPRRLLNDWEVEEFLIPKGTVVLMNIWGANYDDKVWTKPEKFDPERFLSEDQVTLVNTEKIFSFGFGKRRCIGEPIAKVNLMLAATMLVQQFSFHVDPIAGPPLDGDIHGFNRDAVPYNVVIKARLAGVK